MVVQNTQILLIVSADKNEQERIGKMLLPLKNCIFVNSANEAFSLVSTRVRPSLILIDGELPDDGAYSLYSRLRSKTKYETIPVIFMVNKVSATEARFLSLGASDVVIKTCSADVIRNRIDKVLNEQYMNDYLVSKVYSYKDSLKAEHEKLVSYTKQVICALSSAIDAKDTYTKGHSMRVAEYSCLIAKGMGLNEHMCEIIYQAGLLHDIGKIGVSDAVLRKPGELNSAELEAIRNHPMVGYNILSSITELPLIAQGARNHHERYDGMGYPDKLKGSDIPLIARIICVADAYDAMTSNRSYREPLTPGQAADEIMRCSGSQFDPDVASIAYDLIMMNAWGSSDETGSRYIFSSRYLGEVSYA